MKLHKSTLLHWLILALVFPCLGSWLLVRLWIPFIGHLPGVFLGVGALCLSALFLLLSTRFLLRKHLLPPKGVTWGQALSCGILFLLGGCFDISYAMLDASGTLIAHPFFRILCHGGNGIICAAIFLALFTTGQDLLPLGRINRRQFLILFLFLNAVTALYAFTSQTVYVWDNAGYWTVARDLAAADLGYAQLRSVLETTITLDYNYLLAFPISLVMRIFGGSRAVFLFAIANLYTLPGLWGLCALSREKKWGGIVLAALFPMLIYIGLVGFVDVAACSLGIWAYVIYTSDAPPISRGLFSGTLLVGTFLLRRYFFFFAISFGVAALLVKLLTDRRHWQDFLSLFGSCAVCSFAFTYSFLLEKVLGNNYGDLYSAYALGLKSDLLLFCRYFGLIFLLLIILLTLVAFSRKELRPQLIFGLVQPAICFVAFVIVQSHGQQHCLMYLPGLALLSVTSLTALPHLLPGFLAAAVVITGNCFIPKLQPASISEISFPDLIPSFHFFGPQRSDIDQLLALSDYIDSLSAQEPHTAVILASSLLLNTETIPNLRPSLSLPEQPFRTILQYHGSVDKRDGFNWNTATADYLIIGNPVQVHLGEKNQQIVSILAHHVLDGTGPGSAYVPLPETFTLSDGSIVRVFARQRNWTAEEYHMISDPLTAAYPEYAALYQPPSWIE